MLTIKRVRRGGVVYQRATIAGFDFENNPASDFPELLIHEGRGVTASIELTKAMAIVSIRKHGENFSSIPVRNDVKAIEVIVSNELN